MNRPDERRRDEYLNVNYIRSLLKHRKAWPIDIGYHYSHLLANLNILAISYNILPLIFQACGVCAQALSLCPRPSKMAGY